MTHFVLFVDVLSCHACKMNSSTVHVFNKLSKKKKLRRTLIHTETIVRLICFYVVAKSCWLQLVNHIVSVPINKVMQQESAKLSRHTARFPFQKKWYAYLCLSFEWIVSIDNRGPALTRLICLRIGIGRQSGQVVDDDTVQIVHIRYKSKAHMFGTPVDHSSQTNNLSRNLVTKRFFYEFCLARNRIICTSPSVRITCSNKLQSLKTPSYGPSTNPSVYHHLLNHAQCLSSVGLIKEQNCVDVLVLILTSHVFRLTHFLFNVFVRGASMHLVIG